MDNFLDKIIEQKQQEVAKLKDIKKSFKKALLNKGPAVIAEIKRKSPSKGSIATINDPVELAKQYVSGGADAISVLTDKEFFGGSLQDMINVSNAVSVPILRKDFIIDPIQIAESVAAGADAILLIVAILQTKTKELLATAKAMNIDALVEVHNQEELELAVAAGAEIIGINNRDLKTFQVDINNALQLIPLIPNNIVKVAESGIDSPATAKKMFQAGFDAILIGESLVRAENPVNFIKSIKEHY